jgi:hypothetical protein
MEDSNEGTLISSEAGTMCEKSVVSENMEGEKIEAGVVRTEAKGGVGETGSRVPTTGLPAISPSSGVESDVGESGGSVTETTGPRGDGTPRSSRLEAGDAMSPCIGPSNKDALP